MKALTLAWLFALLLATPVLGQARDNQTGTTDQRIQPGGTELRTPAAVKDVQPLTAPKKPAGTVLRREVIYGGVVGDLIQARKAPVPSNGPFIRRPQPVDNVSYYPNTERPQGFVLFAIRF